MNGITNTDHQEYSTNIKTLGWGEHRFIVNFIFSHLHAPYNAPTLPIWVLYVFSCVYTSSSVSILNSPLLSSQSDLTRHPFQVWNLDWPRTQTLKLPSCLYLDLAWLPLVVVVLFSPIIIFHLRCGAKETNPLLYLAGLPLFPSLLTKGRGFEQSTL